MNWKKIFDKLGMNGTVWQWRIRKYEENLIILKKNMGGKYFSELGRNRACTCGAIITPEDRVCPRCRAKVSPYFIEVFRRILGLKTSQVIAGTAIFVFLSVADFIFSMAYGGITSLMSPGNKTLWLSGAMLTPFNGDWWTIITSIFVHIGIAHIGFNMFALIQVGPVLEQILGFKRFFSIFMITGISASMATMFLLQNAISAGASGSLFGLIGMGITYFHRNNQNRIRNFFLKWAIYAFAFGIFIGANNVAHIAGALSGLLMGCLLETRQKKNKILDILWLLLTIILGLLLAGSFIMLIISITYRINVL
ncbi:MAG TPA: rhomboid family intramembrane serine protease [Candidatus Eremiobacteraeota bacterium]|nr:MAG: Rhomboid protease GluP [bacterium ADurb.Bin363]HPZ10155.1 rhomboid family intramembrane serine protease [Candidatus Eremiobacteraeota bacterium]